MNRFLPQAGSLRSNEDIPEPSRDLAEAEKVPWAMTYWNKLRDQLFRRVVAQKRGRAADQIQEFYRQTRHA